MSIKIFFYSYLVIVKYKKR